VIFPIHRIVYMHTQKFSTHYFIYFIILIINIQRNMCYSFRCKFRTNCNNTSSANLVAIYTLSCVAMDLNFNSLCSSVLKTSLSVNTFHILRSQPTIAFGTNSIDLGNAICLHTFKKFYSPVMWGGGKREK